MTLRGDLATLVGVVCDGIGSLPNGRAAAATATATFLAAFTKSHGSIGERLREATHAANQSVHKTFLGASGTTLAAVATDASHGCWFVTVGDTRVLCGTKEILKQVSIDDTIQARFAEFRKPETTGLPSDKSLIQFVGMGNDMQPTVRQLSRDDGDRALVLTDGAYVIGTANIDSISSHADSPREVTERITQMAEWLSGIDNATALFMHIERSAKSLKTANDNPNAIFFYALSGNSMMVDDCSDCRPERHSSPTNVSEQKQPNEAKRKRPGKRKGVEQEHSDHPRGPKPRLIVEKGFADPDLLGTDKKHQAIARPTDCDESPPTRNATPAHSSAQESLFPSNVRLKNSIGESNTMPENFPAIPPEEVVVNHDASQESLPTSQRMSPGQNRTDEKHP